MKLTFDNYVTLAKWGIPALVLLYLYNQRQGIGSSIVDTIGNGLQAINPMNNNNFVNQVATSWYQGLTGSTGTIGTDAFDVLNPDPTAMMFYSAKPTAGQIARQENIGALVPAYPVPGGYGDTSKYFDGRDMVNINGGWGIE